jgi:DNA topoisomerase-1
MASNLVIVESPAKAKTIEKFLGKDFVVKSSFGHIRDLPKSGMGIDIEGNTFEPTYEVSFGKGKVVTELKRALKTATTVWLAADPDREGEAIAWHVFEELKLGKGDKKVHRISFPEITKEAVSNAVKNPGNIDRNLVDAQQARRVLDRLVGYELSPVLWRKIQTGLSAGRVQSVAVRLLVEREREIEAFTPESSFKITAEFAAKGEGFTAELPEKFATKKEAEEFLKTSLAGEFAIKSVEKKPAKRNPLPPFTTSTLQQKAGGSVKRTMMLAQRLYEAGKITYMRTDSVNLSDTALKSAKDAIYDKYGKNFHEERKYKTKSKGAQEAHEAIRPTNFSVEVAGEDDDQKRLYNLIWRRAIASQMAAAEFERTTFILEQTTNTSDQTNQHQLVAKGEILTFEGFLKAYGASEDDKILPNLSKGDAVELDTISAREGFSRPPARYTEATLVRTLEEKEIGRPSTYAPTISTIQDRGYVMKGISEGEEREYVLLEGTKKEFKKSQKISEKKETEKTGSNLGKLVPTSTGTVVNDFLVKHFSDIVEYQFTANVEKEFDEIAEGSKKWNAMIQEFYAPFHKNIDHKMETVERSEAINERVLGDDPKTGKPLSVRVGRFGAYAQIGTKDDEEKPTFASLRPNQNMDTITFEEALELFKLPRLVGQTPEGDDIKANFGRFGPYIQFKDPTAGKVLYQSLKNVDPMDVTLEQALELVSQKRQAEKEKYIKNFRDDPDAKTEGEKSIEILKGRWGPYVTDGEKNIRVPKDIEDATTLTLKDCKKLLKDAKPIKGKKKAGGRKTVKKAAKKTVKKTVKKAPSKKTSAKK